MPQIPNPHPTTRARHAGLDPASRFSAGRAFLVAALTASMLSACGSIAPEGDGGALALLNPQQLAEKLPPEARAVVTSYKQDLRAAAKAHVAQFGTLPASFADIASVARARQTAVSLLADGLSEQIPFASRETVETAANGLVTATERALLDQMRTENAPNP